MRIRNIFVSMFLAAIAGIGIVAITVFLNAAHATDNNNNPKVENKVHNVNIPIADADQKQKQGQKQQQGPIQGQHQGNVNLVGVEGSRSSSSSSSAASSSSNNDVDIVITEEAEKLGDRVPDVIAPGLTSTNGTCLGSFSAGVGISGVGVSGGKTILDEGCDRRYNAARMHDFGYSEIALEIMCADEEVYEAAMRVAQYNNQKPVCAGDDPSSTAYNPINVNFTRDTVFIDDEQFYLGDVEVVTTFEADK